MTDLAANASPALDTRAIVQRRLTGLLVLLLIAFVISLLLRSHAPAPDDLPAVIIPLNGSSAPVDPAASTSTVPTLDAPEAANDAPAILPKASEPRQVSVPKPAAAVEKPRAEKPVPAKPAADKPTKADNPAAATAAKNEAARKWFVAIGAYKDPMAAQAIASRIKGSGFSAGTVPVVSAGERLHRVRAGPFASKAEAESARATLIVDGLTKAVTVSEK